MVVKKLLYHRYIRGVLSILIPVYMYDAVSLAQEVVTSANQLQVPWELILADDHSPDEAFYKSLKSTFLGHNNVKVIRLESNKGRATIRNFLITKAQYDYAVFIDGDSQILDTSTFLKTYVQQLNPRLVLVGGRIYDHELPSKAVELHWLYGTNRESRSLQTRTDAPLRYFFTNNFCCAKDLVAKFPFDESFVGWGYEDTQWGQRIADQGYQIKHIENSIIHKGLDNNDRFIDKAKESIKTLAQMSTNTTKTPIKLLEVHQEMAGSWYGRLALNCISLTAPLALSLFRSGLRSLWLYDYWRLGLLRRTLKKSV